MAEQDPMKIECQPSHLNKCWEELLSLTLRTDLRSAPTSLYKIYNIRKWLYWYWYTCQLQFSRHPVAVVQYTFTHKQYTEQHH